MLFSLFFGYLSDFAPNQIDHAGHGRDRLWWLLFVTAGGHILGLSDVTRPNTLTSFLMLFAAIRARSLKLGAAEAISINSMARVVYSFSWIVVPGLVGVYVAASGNLIDSFAFAAGALLVSVLVYARFGVPTVGSMAGNGNAAGLREALRLIGHRRVFLPVFALALIGCVMPFNQALTPLLVVGPKGGSARDVGILSGLVAFLEMPLMLLTAFLARHRPVCALIILGRAIHALYLCSLFFVDTPLQVYVLAVPNAAGAAILFTMHLNYCHELIQDRTGLGTSLMSVVQLLSNGVNAVIFAVGQSAGIHVLTALIGAIVITA